MPASVFHRAPLFVSDQVLLGGDAQDVLERTASGSTAIAGASGMLVQPYQAGYRLLEAHARACRYTARRRYRCDLGLGPKPGQNPKVRNT